MGNCFLMGQSGGGVDISGEYPNGRAYYSGSYIYPQPNGYDLNGFQIPVSNPSLIFIGYTSAVNGGIIVANIKNGETVTVPFYDEQLTFSIVQGTGTNYVVRITTQTKQVPLNYCFVTVFNYYNV